MSEDCHESEFDKLYRELVLRNVARTIRTEFEEEWAKQIKFVDNIIRRAEIEKLERVWEESE
jgi:hypothetical protein